MRNHLRWWLMPGLDLFTRRRVRLCSYWLSGSRRVLDAGSGNGWFSYLAYRLGATVIAVNIAQDQVQKATQFYNLWRGIPLSQLKFIKLNVYNLDCLEPGFDEIICYETLEHIKDDVKICKLFWKLLKPGGFLHLCSPYAEHPRWRKERLDIKEKGGHVREGYTLESYRSMLEPIGFQIIDTEGMGGPILTKVCFVIQALKNRFGNVWCLPFVLLAIPLIWLDPRHMNRPYSLYVKAVKRSNDG
ncbi:MAG: class I SAM-dependent methyltransferase [Candidatus Omnitrophota bacterium]|nr:class I SAM-dependent methyltransferase [Candidatus Omnitrophota bacterium]